MKIARLASLFVSAGSLLAQAACTAKTETSATAEPTAKTVECKPSAYQGWKSLNLSNQFVSMHIVPEVGGRIMQYSLGADPFFWVNQELAGKAPPSSGVGPENSWLNYGGDKLWPAPQGWDTPEQWPGPPDAILDGGAYKLETLPQTDNTRAVRLTSGDDLRSGIRFSRVIRLHEGSTRVSFEATMKNIDSKPRRWGIWAITQLDGGKAGGGHNALMRAYCPINPKSHFANGYSVIFGDEKNPSFQADPKRNLMTVNYLYKVGKIGLDSPGGWVATVNGATGKVFVQRAAFEARKDYPEGASVEFWHNGLGSFKAWGKDNVMQDDPVKNPYVFESEILSPFANLKPGESYTWKYDWYAASIGTGKHEVVDCTAAGVVSEPLQVAVTGDAAKVTGRFGVFAPGTMTIEFKDVQGRVLVREALGKVSPTAAIVLDQTLKLPAGAVSAALVITDTAGACQTLQKRELR